MRLNMMVSPLSACLDEVSTTLSIPGVIKLFPIAIHDQSNRLQEKRKSSSCNIVLIYQLIRRIDIESTVG